MNTKRVSYLVAVAAGAFAIAWPAAAQANGPYWYSGGVLVGNSANKLVGLPISGSWHYTDNTGFQLHPCAFTGTRDMWNTPTVGVGEVTAATFAMGCKTSIVGCTAAKLTPKNLPWPTLLMFVGAAIWDEVQGMTIQVTLDNGAACKKVGLGGAIFNVTGGLKSLWSAPTSCETFSEEGMGIEEGGEVKTGGEMCFATESEISAE